MTTQLFSFRYRTNCPVHGLKYPRLKPRSEITEVITEACDEQSQTSDDPITRKEAVMLQFDPWTSTTGFLHWNLSLRRDVSSGSRNPKGAINGFYRSRKPSLWMQRSLDCKNQRVFVEDDNAQTQHSQFLTGGQIAFTIHCQIAFMIHLHF